jgi:hypothetical protein
MTDNPISCEISALIRFLQAKSKSAVEIHGGLGSAVYGQNVMSEGTVGQRCRTFKERQTNVPDEERSGRPPVVSDDIVQHVDKKISEKRCFTISERSCEFPHISHNLLCDIVTVCLGYHKFVQDWFRKCTRVGTRRREWLRL